MKENEFELIITEKSLGALTTNAQNIKEKVQDLLPTYDVKNYSIDNIDKAKEDKALLNKTSKALNDKRIEIEKEFMQPFVEFKTTIAETCDLIKEASSKIDEIVKTKEQEEKDLKKTDIQKYFDENVGNLKDLINLDKIFNDKWLNKTYKIEDIQEEILNQFKNINEGLDTISSLNSKYEIELKNTFLKNLNINEAIQKNKELLENEEKLASQSRIAEIDKVKQEEKKLEESSMVVVEEKVFDPIETYTLEITAKRSQLLALREFLKNNNMDFKRVENKEPK